MKWYIAGRTMNYQQVGDLVRTLRIAGETVDLDWSEIVASGDEGLRPYGANPEPCHSLADKMRDAVLACDRFVLLSDPTGIGMHVEYGIALGRDIPPIMYVVGEHNTRSIFFMHKYVTRVDTVEEMLGIERIGGINRG